MSAKPLHTYVVASDTNNGLMVHVANAPDKQAAFKMAKPNRANSAGAWDDATAHRINTRCRGVVKFFLATGG